MIYAEEKTEYVAVGIMPSLIINSITMERKANTQRFFMFIRKRISVWVCSCDLTGAVSDDLL